MIGRLLGWRKADARARAAELLEAFDLSDAVTKYVKTYSGGMDALTSLLHEDATWSMPPYEMWLRTHEDIVYWCLGPGVACRGSRLIPVDANGSPGFGQYKPGPSGLEPWSLQVVEITKGRIAGISFFLDTARLFPLFALPPRLDP